MKKIISLLLIMTMLVSSVVMVSAEEYVVTEGDVLWEIARDNDTTIDALVELNNIANRDLIYVNQVLQIPGSEAGVVEEIPAVADQQEKPDSPMAGMTPVEYTVIDRVDAPTTAAFTPTAAESTEDDLNENVTVVIERILNEQAFMLKQGTVQPVGNEDLSSWQLASDEGGAVEQTAPNPLSYMTVGIASNLLTQLERGIDIMELDVDSVKVETVVSFRWKHVMTPEWAGFTDKVDTSIIFESNESAEILAELEEFAINSWVAGEGLANETEIIPELVINGEHWNENYSVPGSVTSDFSIVDDFKVAERISEFAPSTLEVGEDIGGTEDGFMNPNADIPEGGMEMSFNVSALAETTDDQERPYLQKVTVRATQVNYVPWVVYVDDSYGSKGIDKAPTSLDYLTAGTGLCLTSQLAVSMVGIPVQVDDFRVEQQIDYRVEDAMTTDMVGYTDSILSYVMVQSDSPKEAVAEYFNRGVRMCFAGEAFLNETEMVTNMYLNGEIVD